MQHSGQVLADDRKDHKEKTEVQAASRRRMVFGRRNERIGMDRVQDREGQGLLPASPQDARQDSPACNIYRSACSEPLCVS